MVSSLMKQFHRLLRNVNSFSDGQVEVLLDGINFDQPLEMFNIRVRPNGGPYEGGTFEFSIAPHQNGPPEVLCETQIYHPNIDPDDNSLCFNLISELWEDSVTLEDLVQGLLFLFYHPEIEDPLSHLFSGGESWFEFKENVKKSLRGESIGDYDFERNMREEKTVPLEGNRIERRHSMSGDDRVIATSGETTTGTTTAVIGVPRRFLRALSLGSRPVRDEAISPANQDAMLRRNNSDNGDSDSDNEDDDDDDDDDEDDADSDCGGAVAGVAPVVCTCKYQGAAVGHEGTSVDECCGDHSTGASQVGIKQLGRRLTNFFLNFVGR